MPAAHLQVQDVQTWLDPVKGQINSLDPVMEQYLSSYVLGRLMDTFNNSTFGVSTWTDFNTTPILVKQSMAMMYAAWWYDRQYSELVSPESGHLGAGTPYGSLLRDNAEMLLEGIISGSILLVEIQPNSPAVLPEFYPTDASSTTDAAEDNADPDDFSNGPTMFGVAKIF